MSPEQCRKVWQTLDRDHLARVARSGPEPVFAAISGAHLYGFASPDSDVDLRGAFIHPAAAILGLHPPDETVTVVDPTLIDLDWVAHDIRKFARLMTNHNGYVLEQLFSPLVVLTSPAHDELRDLGRGCLTRGTFRHYRGFAHGRRRRLAQPDPTVKHLLYAYRVYLTGIHLMQTGEIESNIATLNERFRLPEIDDLIARKVAGAEKMPLAEAELPAQSQQLDRLDEQLEQAHAASHLPELPQTVEALDTLVVRLRLDAAHREGA
jgi:predicted nucleotidyltransferase